MQAITPLSFIGSFDMIRTTITAAALTIGLLAVPATCTLIRYGGIAKPA